LGDATATGVVEVPALTNLPKALTTLYAAAEA